MMSIVEARARRLNNLPTRVVDDRPFPQRALTSWWTWLTLGLGGGVVDCTHPASRPRASATVTTRMGTVRDYPAVGRLA